MPPYNRRSYADRNSVATTELARADGLEGCKSRVLAAFKGSKIPDKTGDLPRFDIEELEVGDVLGKGQFGTISEILAFKVCPRGRDKRYQSSRQLGGGPKLSYRFGDDSNNSSDSDNDDAVEKEQAALRDVEARAFLAKHAIRDDGRARYAVKVLSNNVMCDNETFIQGISDIAVETRILSNMEHPNIMKLRAHAKVDPYNEYYFIVMDRLHEKMDERIEKWDRRMNQSGISCIAPFLMNKKDMHHMKSIFQELYKEKVQIVYDLAEALLYVHKLGIVYRDLKTENIGFDIRGDVRLFDFGLSKELRSNQKDDKGTYKLTQLGVGLEGNPKYIAPEVANGEPYNEKCDSYSFAILVWQCMSCQTPYEQHRSIQSFQEQVWIKSNHERPAIEEYWPVPIKLLMKRSWTHDLHERNSMKSISCILRQECIAFLNGMDSSLDHVKRRSTFIFRKDDYAVPKLKPEPYGDRRTSFALTKRKSFSAKSLSQEALAVDPRKKAMAYFGETTASARSLLGGKSRRTRSKPKLVGEYDNVTSSDDCTIASSMTAAERRDARQRSFELKAQRSSKTEKKESAERQVRRSSIGDTAAIMGGLELPAGVFAASDRENIADAVHLTDRDTIVQSKLSRQGSSRSLRKSQRNLMRESSNRSLGSVGSDKSNGVDGNRQHRRSGRRRSMTNCGNSNQENRGIESITKNSNDSIDGLSKSSHSRTGASQKPSRRKLKRSTLNSQQQQPAVPIASLDSAVNNWSDMSDIE